MCWALFIFYLISSPKQLYDKQLLSSPFYRGGKLRHQEVGQLAQGHTASGSAGSGCLPLSGPHFLCLYKGVPGSPGSGVLVLVPVLGGAGVS